jgi:hypothetical protein
LTNCTILIATEAIDAPTNVPMADQSITMSMKSAHSIIGWNGGPAKTGKAEKAVTANGQMSLGRGFFLMAAITHVTNAIAAPTGRMRMIEKSTTSH